MSQPPPNRPAFACPPKGRHLCEVPEQHLPGRRVVQVEIPSIAIGGGDIHCITKQEPKA
ncbi:agmatine deiminase family protein [Rhodobacteraceae bacterium KMM 6894]|nr:agmatine deiminase family protein [Rhodobacteraceae bacterium KMM 6894]